LSVSSFALTYSIFAKKLDIDFNQNSVSVIPVDGNYFVGFMKILQQYQIPFIALFDEDVIFTIYTHIEFENEKINTSTLINQLNEMKLLNDEDKKCIREWKKKIISQINTSSAQYKLSSIINRLKTYTDNTDNPEIKQIYENNKQDSNFSYSEKYDQTIKQEIYALINQKAKENDYSFHFLSPNFEKFFQDKGFGKFFSMQNKSMAIIKFFVGNI
jgi:hypothetical protein